MGVAKKFDGITYSLNICLRRYLVRHDELKNIKKKSKLIEKVSLSKEQENEITTYYKRFYGKAISTSWHRLYQSYTGTYRVNYFPEILFSTELEPKTNPYRVAEFLGDKNLLETLFADIHLIHIPKTYVSCVGGVLRNGEYNIIDREEAKLILKKLTSFVIKKTCDTSSGRDVHLFKGDEDPSLLLEQFGNDFVVQETIKQHETLDALNHTSVNTFRVITYFCEGKLYSCPVALRMGRSNADKDNIHYGGIGVGVNQDGSLKETAFSEYGESYKEHPDTHVIFANYIVDVKPVVSAAIQLHAHVPYLGILSWDLTLDSNGVPTLIEMNSTGQAAWFCQMVNGEPLFGDNTPAMLSLIKK